MADDSVSPTAPARARQNSPLTNAVITGGFLLFGASFFFAFHGCSLHPTRGTLTASGPEIGNWTMQVNRCHTGAKRGFFGAQLFDSGNPKLGLYMVEDPLKGMVASVNSTTRDYAINLTRAECKTLRGGVRSTSTMVNYQTVMKGSWDLDCQWTDESGGDNHVSGHFESSHCL